MQYRRIPGFATTLEALRSWIDGELMQLEEAFAEQDFVQLKVLNVAPPKPRDGLTVMADGTNWNPGSGRGVYTYYSGAWNKLG